MQLGVLSGVCGCYSCCAPLLCLASSLHTSAHTPCATALPQVFSHTNFWDAPRLGALRHFSRLTRLSLRDDRLQSLPRALGHLRALVELDISRNSFCGPHDPLRALGLLPQLLALNLSLCHLHAVPVPLAHLSCLTALSLASNEGLGLCGDAVFEPLRHLSALRALDLSHCGLQRAPPQLSALVLLQDLDLSRNDDLADAGGEGGALSALGSLTGLTRLNLRCGRLGLGIGVPPAATLCVHGCCNMCPSGAVLPTTPLPTVPIGLADPPAEPHTLHFPVPAGRTGCGCCRPRLWPPLY